MSAKRNAGMAGVVLEAMRRAEEAAMRGEMPSKRLHTCLRCERVASAAEKRGDALPPVNEAETWVGANGVVYHAGLCRDCADLEWSANWDRQFARETSETKKAKLTEVLDERTRRGRRYLGTRRPGGPAPAGTPHAEGCRCSECRAKEIARVQREQDTSLFPPGYGPQPGEPA